MLAIMARTKEIATCSLHSQLFALACGLQSQGRALMALLTSSKFQSVSMTAVFLQKKLTMWLSLVL